MNCNMVFVSPVSNIETFRDKVPTSLSWDTDVLDGR